MVALTLLAVISGGKYHGGASLVSSLRAVRPGSSFEVAVKIDLDPGWHTYWRNPGDAGIPPRITWKLPVGWTAGDIQWPIPHKLVAPEVVSYGYEHEALLLTKITVPHSARLGAPILLKANVDWLVCQEGCIPATASLETKLKISQVSHPDPVWESKLKEAVHKLPTTGDSGTYSAVMSGKNIVLSFPGTGGKSLVFYPEDPLIEPAAPQTIGSAGDRSTLTMKVSEFAPASAPRLRGLLVSQQGASTTSQTIDIPLRRTKP